MYNMYPYNTHPYIHVLTHTDAHTNTPSAHYASHACTPNVLSYTPADRCRLFIQAVGHDPLHCIKRDYLCTTTRALFNAPEHSRLVVNKVDIVLLYHSILILLLICAPGHSRLVSPSAPHTARNHATAAAHPPKWLSRGAALPAANHAR